MKPDFEFERAAHARGFERVAGVDEVGRGPLAGVPSCNSTKAPNMRRCAMEGAALRT